MVAVLMLPACSQAQATPVPIAPTFLPLDLSTPAPVATPTPIPTPTLSPKDATIEAEWLIQKPKIEAAVDNVYNGLTSPWLTPMLDINITSPTPDSPAAHCQAMELWSNYIPLPDLATDCRAGHNPLTDFFATVTRPLEKYGTDSLIMEVFPFMPIPFCDGVNPCGLLPGPGGAYYGMTIGRYKIVEFCGDIAKDITNGTLTQPSPYLKDPVSMILLATDGTGYIQIVANRGAWFSYGWISGKGWSESYQFCPTY